MALDDYHIYPSGDLRIHHLNEDCWCGPECIPVELDDAQIKYQYVHHALDGREHREPDHDKASCPLCSSELS